MKMNKSLLAVAIGAVSFAGSAQAAVDLYFGAGEQTIVLASEIFGDEAVSGTAPTQVGGGVGGNETLVQMEVTTLDLDTTVAGLLDAGDNVNTGLTSSVKYTLGGDAVFGEDLSTTALVLAANGGAGAFSCTAAAVGNAVADSANDAICGLTATNAVSWQVVQGGAIGDNTITIEFTTNVAEATIGGMTFGNIKVKNLVSQLGDQGNHTDFRGKVEFGVEYVEGAETTVDTISTTATDLPLVVFGSQPGLKLAGTAVDFNAANFIRINVGNGEKTFTGNTADGRSDFDPANDTSWVKLGDLQLQRQAIDTGTFTAAAAGVIKKEFGGDFDFQGGDKHTLSFTAGSGSFQSGGTVYLAVVGGCAAAAPIAGLSGTSVTVTNSTTTSLSTTVTGSTTALTTKYDLCYSVKTGANATNIPEVADIGAKWHVNFFNTRYDDQDYAYSSYGPLKRNGCVASLFNIPGSNNAIDTAFVRLTNTSTTNTGDIRGTLYAQDGSILGAADTTIAPALAVHATQVFSSLAEDSVTANGTIVSIEKAFGVTPDEYKGRARLVLKGAFDTCEAMGLIRNSETKALYNMTSTTQGNEAAAPNDGNNAN